MIRISITTFFLLMTLIVCGCDFPFFPRTGAPSAASTLRRTPAGVKDQLVKAYESRRIDLYKDLFSQEGDFRFYVSENYSVEFRVKPYAQLPEKVGGDIKNIDTTKLYYYWNYDGEVRRHERMFSVASDIKFTNPFIFSLSEAIFTVREKLDTVVTTASDSVTVDIRRILDTTNVEFKLWGGEITITLEDTTYLVDIGLQNIYLKRDKNNPLLWVISKWFDLGIAQ